MLDLVANRVHFKVHGYPIADERDLFINFTMFGNIINLVSC